MLHRPLGVLALAVVAVGAAAGVPAPAEDATRQLTPVVGYPVAFTVSRAVRDLPAAPARPIDPDRDPREVRNPSLAAARSRRPPINRVIRLSQAADQALDSGPARHLMDPPIATFEGVSNFESGALVGAYVSPPDTNGDVGPNHYVQAVNLAVRIFDKSGVPQTFPFLMSSLFGGEGPCSSGDDGDPIVLYDHLADRWLLSQFRFPTGLAAPFFQCVAISQTADPAGPYFAYTFQMPGDNLNDYPHFGVWPDAYYMTDNQLRIPFLGLNGGGNFAFDRLKMLAGDPTAAFIYFDGSLIDPGLGGLLASDLDGPARVRPNILASLTADELGDPMGDGLRLFEFAPDFTAPASSTFTELPFLPVAAFDPVSPSGRAHIPQPGTAIRLDAVPYGLMHRLQYRSFGTHESLVVAHTVDTSGDPVPSVYRAGVRYYELRRTLPAGAWTVREQASYAPADGVNRWMPSAALDDDGNLAVGFSVSNELTVFPGIRYAGRLAGDPLGGLAQGENTLQAGTGAQTAQTNRWGDYSMLAVDPVDDCTFWFTSEYYTPPPGPGCFGAGAAVCWQTRVGSFKFPSCTPPDAAGALTGTITNAVTLAPVAGALVTATGGYAALTSASGLYTMDVPAGTYTVTASRTGFSNVVVSGAVVTSGGATVVDLALPPVAILAFVSRTIDDSAGNNNGHVDPSECLATVVNLRNDGAAAASALSATLTTSTPHVAVVTGALPYADLAPGAMGANATPFRFQTSAAFVPGTTIHFTLEIASAQGPRTVSFTMPSGTPHPAGSSFSATGPVPIPDGSLVGANLPVTVAGITGSIAKVRVAARITHTWDGDLALSVRGPDGTTVMLAFKRGGTGDDFGTDCPADDGDDTIFDDEAALRISDGAAPFVGTFRPEQPLLAFQGKSGEAVNGTWVFRVVDTLVVDVGRIECVTLIFNGYQTAGGPGGCVPNLEVNDVTVPEGQTGSLDASFTVTLSRPAAAPVTVEYATADGTATAGEDYTARSGTLTFAPGVTSQPLAVPVLGDTLNEGDETFTVNLSQATGPAVLTDAQGVGTIAEDDRRYHAVTPCRLVDTRGGPPLAAGSSTNFTVTGGACAVPADAAAVMINVTVAQQTDLGNLRIYPAGMPEPLSSTINFVVGRVRANNAIVSVGTDGQLRVKVDMPAGSGGGTQLVIDVYGYFK